MYLLSLISFTTQIRMKKSLHFYSTILTLCRSIQIYALKKVKMGKLSQKEKAMKIVAQRREELMKKRQEREAKQADDPLRRPSPPPACAEGRGGRLPVGRCFRHPLPPAALRERLGGANRFLYHGIIIRIVRVVLAQIVVLAQVRRRVVVIRMSPCTDKVLARSGW